MDAAFGALPLLSREAFPVFLPAWLMRSLDNLDAEQHKFREWTLYTLALYHNPEHDEADELPDKCDRLIRRYEGLTPEQVTAVSRFLRMVRDHARISEWDRQSIDRALDVLAHP